MRVANFPAFPVPTWTRRPALVHLGGFTIASPLCTHVCAAISLLVFLPSTLQPFTSHPFVFSLHIPSHIFYIPLYPSSHFPFHSLHYLPAATHEHTTITPFKYKAPSCSIPRMFSYQYTFPQLSAQAQSDAHACCHTPHHQQMASAQQITARDIGAPRYRRLSFSAAFASNCVAPTTPPELRHISPSTLQEKATLSLRGESASSPKQG